MEVDVSKIPSLGAGYVQTDASGNLSVDGLTFDSGNILYLNANGYAGTPERGNPFKPYQTHSAVLSAAVDGDLIYIIGSHSTEINLAKQGCDLTYYRPTIKDGLTFNTDGDADGVGVAMVFTGADSEGTCVTLCGEGFTRAVGVTGEPCIFMTASLTDHYFKHLNGTLEVHNICVFLPSATEKSQLSGKLEINAFSNSSLLAGSAQTDGLVEISNLEVIINVENIPSLKLFSIAVGGPSSQILYKNISVKSNKAQTNDLDLFSQITTANNTQLIIDNVSTIVDTMNIFEDLLIGVEQSPTIIGRVISTNGDIGLGTAEESDLNFRGSGVISANDRTLLIEQSNYYSGSLIESKTGAFNTTTEKNDAYYRYDSVSDNNATILWNSVLKELEGQVVEQVNTGKITFVAGAGVTLIKDENDNASTTGIRSVKGFILIAQDTGLQTATYKII